MPRNVPPRAVGDENPWIEAFLNHLVYERNAGEGGGVRAMGAKGLSKNKCSKDRCRGARPTRREKGAYLVCM